MSSAPKLCANCGAPVGAGGARGLDSRCYKFQRRNGRLPPVERAESMGMTESIEVRMTPGLLRRIERGAKSEGVTPSEWVRGACDALARESK